MLLSHSGPSFGDRRPKLSLGALREALGVELDALRDLQLLCVPLLSGCWFSWLVSNSLEGKFLTQDLCPHQV